MSSILVPRSLKKQREILQKSSYNISSCTKRLVQIQQQLEAQKYLQQEYVSSMIMKDNAFMKLLEQQNLLIFHLKQELRQLEAWEIECKRLENIISTLQIQYVTLGYKRDEDMVINYQQLNRVQIEYKTLHQLLNQLTLQSGKKYEELLRFQQRHVVLRQDLKEKTKAYVELKNQYEINKEIGQKKKIEKTKLNEQLVSLKQNNTILTQKFKKQSINLKQNNQKYALLLAQVAKMEQQKRKLNQILKDAQNDNHLLKQSQKDSILKMKLKQQQLQSLSKQKQTLQNQLSTQKDHLNNVLISQNKTSKQNYNTEILQNQRLKQLYQKILQNNYKAESQIQQLYLIKQQYLMTKQRNLSEYLQKRQDFEKHLYFIDQYMILNGQLMRQIEIMMSQDMNKEILVPRYRSRQHLIQSLRGFLYKANQEMIKSQRVINQLRQSLEFYTIEG